MSSATSLPEKIRVSLGTAITLGFLEGKLSAAPTTAYLMTYRTGKCTANCGFCPQARTSKSATELLSRVKWPTLPTHKVLTTIAFSGEQKRISRVCIQALNYPEVFLHLEVLLKEMKMLSAMPISVSCQPQNKENIERLKKAGADRLGIALDAATKALFKKVKGKEAGGTYTWEKQLRNLREALAIFGRGNVSTHLIIGLGETEKEALETIQRCVDVGILPALFAFTPINGTAFESNLPPRVESYRRVQLARYLIVEGTANTQNMSFNGSGKIIDFGLSKELLESIVESSLPFRTSGCPNCNRPYYNEKPSGPIYNYPTKPNSEEIEKIKKELL